MENRTLKTALITIFYIFGLCTFFSQCQIAFSCFIAVAIIFLCLTDKIKPFFCILLFLLFFVGYFNAKFQNKNFDSFSEISSANNVTIKGRVYSIPNISAEKKIAKFYLGVYMAKIFNRDFQPQNTKILVSIYDDNKSYDDIRIGDIIEIKGRLRQPKEASNPGEFDYKKYLKNKGVFSILYSNIDTKKHPKKCAFFKILKHPDIKDSKNKPKELWWKALQTLDIVRDSIIAKHAKHIKSPNLEVLGGIVFGDDAVNTPDDVKQNFINSGLLHLLAASGLNVALIFAIWWAFCRLINLGYKAKLISGIFIIALYTFMTGFPPSILRAAIMLVLVLIGKLMFKSADNLALIFFTAFLMLLFEPNLLFDIGFELSFLVTGGLIACVEPVCAKFKSADKLYKKKISRLPFWRQKIALLFSPISLLSVFIVPFVAQLWAFPLQMYYFNTFTPYSVFANMAVVPFVGIISFVGFVSSIIGLIPFLGDFVIWVSSFILNPLITFLLFISEFFSNLPASIIKAPSGTIFKILIYYILLVVLTMCIKNDFKKAKENVALGVLLVALFCCVFSSLLINFFNKDLEVIAFDVGNADNFLIKTPKNKYIMIDTGRLPYKSVSSAKRITLQHLYDKNIKTLEYLIITHFDSDHSGGTVDILDNIRVKNTLIQKKTCDTKNSCDILNYIKNNNVNARIAQNNETFYREDDFEVKTIVPVVKKLNIDDKENENSIFVLIKHKNEHFLFLADGGILAFNNVKNNLPKNIKFLKVGHHGAKNVVNKEMLEYLKPEYSIISTGQNNYGHPNAETIRLLKDSGTKIYSTKEFGAIKFIFSKDDTKVFGFKADKRKGFENIKNNDYSEASLQINL